MPQVETAAGVQRVDRILQARNLRSYKAPWRVKRVCFGAADYGHDLGLSPTLDEPELADARARIVLSRRPPAWKTRSTARGSTSRRRKRFARALERSRRGGFQGRCCVHPDQIAPGERGLYAERRGDRLGGAHRLRLPRGREPGAAAIQVDGQMIDYPIAHRARRRCSTPSASHAK